MATRLNRMRELATLAVICSVCFLVRGALLFAVAAVSLVIPTEFDKIAVWEVVATVAFFVLLELLPLFVLLRHQRKVARISSMYVRSRVGIGRAASLRSLRAAAPRLLARTSPSIITASAGVEDDPLLALRGTVAGGVGPAAPTTPRRVDVHGADAMRPSDSRGASIASDCDDSIGAQQAAGAQRIATESKPLLRTAASAVTGSSARSANGYGSVPLSDTSVGGAAWGDQSPVASPWGHTERVEEHPATAGRSVLARMFAYDSGSARALVDAASPQSAVQRRIGDVAIEMSETPPKMKTPRA